MKTHTTIGHKICMDDLKLRPYAAGTIYHHEALNGTGYPNGVTKKDIPENINDTNALKTLIEVKTVIGKYSALQGTSKAHGSPLAKEDITNIKEKLGVVVACKIIVMKVKKC